MSRIVPITLLEATATIVHPWSSIDYRCDDEFDKFLMMLKEQSITDL